MDGENRNERRPSDGSPVGDPRARVLERATAYVDSVGLTLGVNSRLVQRFSEEAGISTRQFNKIWETPESFLSDLVVSLAEQSKIDRTDTQTLLTTWQYLDARSDELRTPEGRRAVLIDIIRNAAAYNFDVVTASGKWRTYAALSTTILCWPEGEDRDRVLGALRVSQLAFVETMENFYRNVLPTLGYRLRSMFHGDYQPFVAASAGIIEGLGVVRSSVPALVESHFERETGDEPERWTLAALTYMSVLDAFFEPDPDYVPEQAIARLKGGIDVTPPAHSDDLGG